jgi:transposase
MSRAVKRGLARRDKTAPRNIGIDETSFQKHHQYVTVILDRDSDTIIDILDDRKADTLKLWFETQNKSDFSQLQSITMDMWDPFINAVKKNFHNGENLIAFDRFHVSQHFGKALDKVRSEEHRGFVEGQGKSPLVRSKYQWLTNSQRTDNRDARRKEFLAICCAPPERAARARRQSAAINVCRTSPACIAGSESICRDPGRSGCGYP